MKVKYSLIVPTFGRTKELEALFDSFVNSLFKDFEVIVVDQNDDEIILPIVDKYSSRLKIMHLRVDFKCLSKARNYGFKYASGDYITFPDDDCEYYSDTLSKIDKEIGNRKDIVISGKVVDRNGIATVGKFGDKKAKVTLDCMENFVEISEVFPREIFQKFPYNEKLGIGNFYGSGEGADQMLRMLSAGIDVCYNPEILFYHPNKVTRHDKPSEIKRAFYYACGSAYMCKINHVNFAKSRLYKLILYLPYCFIFKRKSFAYYCAELAGLLAGFYVEQ